MTKKRMASKRVSEMLMLLAMLPLVSSRRAAFMGPFGVTSHQQGRKATAPENHLISSPILHQSLEKHSQVTKNDFPFDKTEKAEFQQRKNLLKTIPKYGMMVFLTLGLFLNTTPLLANAFVDDKGDGNNDASIIQTTTTSSSISPSSKLQTNSLTQHLSSNSEPAGNQHASGKGVQCHVEGGIYVDDNGEECENEPQITRTAPIRSTTWRTTAPSDLYRISRTSAHPGGYAPGSCVQCHANQYSSSSSSSSSSSVKQESSGTDDEDYDDDDEEETKTKNEPTTTTTTTTTTYMETTKQLLAFVPFMYVMAVKIGLFNSCAAAAASLGGTSAAAYTALSSVSFLCMHFAEVGNSLAQAFLPPFQRTSTSTSLSQKTTTTKKSSSSSWFDLDAAMPTIRQLLKVTIGMSTFVTAVAAIMIGIFGGTLTNDVAVLAEMRRTLPVILATLAFHGSYVTLEGIVVAQKQFRALSLCYTVLAVAVAAYLPWAVTKLGLAGVCGTFLWFCATRIVAFSALGGLWWRRRPSSSSSSSSKQNETTVYDDDDDREKVYI